MTDEDRLGEIAARLDERHMEFMGTLVAQIKILGELVEAVRANTQSLRELARRLVDLPD